MLAFVRRNAVAFIALFIALSGTSAYAINTVRSQDIVDGQVKTVDLANGAVTGTKTHGMFALSHLATEQTSTCYGGPGQWRSCAPITVTAPLGNDYVVTVTSTVEVDPGNSTVTAQFCPAAPGPTCFYNPPHWATYFPRGVTSSTWSEELSFKGGSLTFCTAVRFSGPLLTDASTETRVEVYSVGFEQGS